MMMYNTKMDNSGVTFEFSGTETVIVFNIIGNLLDSNAIKEDQLEVIKNLHISIFEKLKPYIVQKSDVSGTEVDVDDGSGVDVDDGSGVGEYDGSGVEDCQNGICKLEI